MGAVIGKFRKKRTTLEKLEELDKDIKCIEKYRYHTQQTEKRIVGQFILVSTLVYILAVILYYYMCFPTTLNEQIFYITPLLLVPILIWFIKKILKWYYKKKLNKNEIKLSQLIQEKKRLIEQVMDTETYKVAKTILEKFAPESTISHQNTGTPQFKMSNTLRQRPMAPKTPMPMRTSPVKNFTPVPNQSINIIGHTPGPKISELSSIQKPVVSSAATDLVTKPNLPMLPMPRNILPKDRTVLDKMVEYLVGDGPNNRYALICKNCHGHNGMALREEFEYLSFRCCYCMTYNPSRKLRPSAPKLEDDTGSLIKRRMTFTDKTIENKSSSDSEKISDQSDSDQEQSDKDINKKELSSQENSDNDNDNDTNQDDKKSIVDPTIEKFSNNDNNLNDGEKNKDI